MKKLIYLLLIISLTFTFACKKDKDDKQGLTPKKDTTIYPGYQEFTTDESGLPPDTNKNVSNEVTINNDVKNETVMVEDDKGNLKPATNEDLNKTGNSFYIIVGSFKKDKNAQERANYFIKMNYQAQVLPKFGEYNRVAIANYTTESEARTELKNFRTKFNDKSVWLLAR